MSDDFVVYHQARDQPYSEEFVVHGAGASEGNPPEQVLKFGNILIVNIFAPLMNL